VEVEPDECDQLLQHLGGATPVYVNFAISGIDRVVRDTKTALARRAREESVARHSAEQAIWSELREDVTAMLLSCDLALAVPGLPISAMEKLRSVPELACHLRTKLSGSE
jgi:hypothetical protein